MLASSTYSPGPSRFCIFFSFTPLFYYIRPSCYSLHFVAIFGNEENYENNPYAAATAINTSGFYVVTGGVDWRTIPIKPNRIHRNLLDNSASL